MLINNYKTPFLNLPQEVVFNCASPLKIVKISLEVWTIK